MDAGLHLCYFIIVGDNVSYVLEHLGNNLWRGRFTSFDEKICQHGFAGRLGGVSSEPYKSLNLGLHVGDNPKDVWQNRQIFCQSLGLPATRLVTPEQIHGDRIVRVTEEDAGRGAKEYVEAIAGTDALITDVPNLPLFLCFADCTPVVFLDPEKRAIGIAHAGWKGTVAGIAAKTVARMTAEFGCKPADIIAGIGPAIGPCCYEVGAEVAAKFREAFPEDSEAVISSDNGRLHVNLWEANRRQLLQAGLKRDNIEMADTCTSCEHQWYFSYRADGGRTGRMAAIIALKGE